MRPPENVCSVGGQTSVEWVCRSSGSERWMLSNHDEENDSCGENVDRFTFVWLFQMDFRRHVVKCSQNCLEVALSISPHGWCSEAKVSKLEGVIKSDQNIVRTNVIVCNSIIMAMLQCLKNFLDQASCYLFGKFAIFFDDLNKILLPTKF